MARRNNNNDSAINFVVMVILAIIAMPIVGFFLATSKDQNKHVLGWILVAVGIILWIAVFSG